MLGRRDQCQLRFAWQKMPWEIIFEVKGLKCVYKHVCDCTSMSMYMTVCLWPKDDSHDSLTDKCCLDDDAIVSRPPFTFCIVFTKLPDSEHLVIKQTMWDDPWTSRAYVLMESEVGQAKLPCLVDWVHSMHSALTVFHIHFTFHWDATLS